MERQRVVFAFLLTAMTLPPAVAQPGAIASAWLENNHEHACLDPFVRACLLTIEGSGGDMTVDVSQNISYVGVAINVPQGIAGRPLPLLPDESIVIHGEQLYVPSPHGPLLVALSSQTRPMPQSQWVHVGGTERNVTFEYYRVAIDSWDKPPTIRHHYVAIAYNDDYFSYDRIGIINAPQGDSTDGTVDDVPYGVCGGGGSEWCYSTVEATFAPSKPLLPNVEYGYGFNKTQLATDPEALDSRDHAEAVREVAASSGSYNSSEELLPEDLKRNVPVASTPTAPRPAFGEDPPTQPAPGKTPPASTAVSRRLLPDSDPVPPTVLLAASATAAALGVVAYVLYTRFWRPKDVLQSEARCELLALVTAEPGLSPSTLAKRANVARNTVVHHLQVLERAQLVRLASEGRELFVFPVAASPAASGKVPSLRAARHPVSREVLAILQAHPEGLTRSDLHARMPVVPLRTLNYNVAKLVRAGLVRSEAKQGLADVLALAPAPAPMGARASALGAGPGDASRGSAT